MINSDQNNGRIEELKRKLFSKDSRLIRPQKHGTLHDIYYPTSGNWKHDELKKKEDPKFMATTQNKTSFFKKFFIFSIIFFIISGIFALYMFFGGSRNVTLENIDISILGNTFSSGGEDLPLQIEIVNRNSTTLQLADLLIEYPKGSIDGTDMVVIRKSLGAIGPGKSVHENIKLILFGEQGSTKDIHAKLEYRLSGSSAIFVKEQQYAVSISSAPLALLVDAPITVVSGQSIQLKIKSVLNSKQPAKNIRLTANYPIGFIFEKAVPVPTVNNNVWDMGDFTPGMEKDILIQGILSGQDNEERSFHIYSGEENNKDPSKIGVIYNSFLQTMTISRPFIEANLTINNQDKNIYSVSGNKDIDAVINWSNNLPVAISDVEITAQFSGNAFDKSSVKSYGGFYNSSAKTMLWDKNNNSDFSLIQPGQDGTVTLSFKSLPLFSQGLISEPEIKIAISIKGKKPFESNQIDEVKNLIVKTIKINSDFQIAGKALYNSGPFANTGQNPPKSEEPTTYTISWILKNSSNLISSAKAIAKLPLWVAWISQVSPTMENVTYNDVTREVTWNIGSVYKGTGLTSANREVFFQIKVIPSDSQIGQYINILEAVSLSGTDAFTGDSLGLNRASINTQQIDGVSNSNGNIQP